MDVYSELIAARRRDAPVDEQATRTLLKSTLQAFQTPVDDHAVWWNGEAWRDAAPWTGPVRQRVQSLCDDLHDPSRDDGWRLISRANVFDRADDALDLFLAAMAWGFGDRGYGWRRTADIVNTAGEVRIRSAVATLRQATTEKGYVGAWQAWSPRGMAKLPGLDTAFASKVAYFASFDRKTCRGPLIADVNTAWALWGLTGCWDSRKSAELYNEYVLWAERESLALGCRPDDVERSLFAMGPEIRRAWKNGERA